MVTQMHVTSWMARIESMCGHISSTHHSGEEIRTAKRAVRYIGKLVEVRSCSQRRPQGHDVGDMERRKLRP